VAAAGLLVEGELALDADGFALGALALVVWVGRERETLGRDETFMKNSFLNRLAE
tara:strand:- start:217 stop:381 length:165 start_codon:yes stop_codon:yes gene_type:complete